MRAKLLSRCAMGMLCILLPIAAHAVVWPSAEITTANCHALGSIEALTFTNTTGTCHGNSTTGKAICLRGDNLQPYLEATMTSLGNNQWKLTVKNRSNEPSCTITEVRFPFDAGLYHLATNLTESPHDTNNDGIPDSYFPLPAADKDDIVMTAQLLGKAYRNASRDCPDSGYSCWDDGPSYPGHPAGANLFSPIILLADNNRARIFAATNWPPRKVETQWTADRQSLKYVGENIPIRTCTNNGNPCSADGNCGGGTCTDTSRSYSGLIALVTGNAFTGNPPWMLAADKYTSWLTPKLQAESISPMQYPTWAKTANVLWQIGLQNNVDENLSNLEDQWDEFKTFFNEGTGPQVVPWMYFEGAAGAHLFDEPCPPPEPRCYDNATYESPWDCSNYPTEYQSGYEANYTCCSDIPFPNPDKIGCRGDSLDIRLHPRYKGPTATCQCPNCQPANCPASSSCWDLPAFIHDLVEDEGRHVAFYTRPYGKLFDDVGNPLACNTTAQTGGIEFLQDWQANTRSWGANMMLVDTLARSYYGDPLTIARLLRDGIFPGPPQDPVPLCPPSGGQQNCCGNNVKDAWEECDGTALGACSDGCTASCTCKMFYTVEGAVDLYTAGFFVDSALGSPDLPEPAVGDAGPGRTIEDIRCPGDPGDLKSVNFPELGSYVLNDRILLDGDTNTQFNLFGPCAVCDAAPPATGTVDCHNWVERQSFLLGHTLHSGRGPGDYSPCQQQNTLFRDAVALRVQYDWWSQNPRYVDRKGLRAIPNGIDVRHFTSDTADFLVFDNPSQVSGQQVCFNGKWLNVPTGALTSGLSIVVPDGSGASCGSLPSQPLACPE